MGRKSRNPIEPQTMKAEHFEQVIHAYVNAISGAKKIGCDGVEIHGGR